MILTAIFMAAFAVLNRARGSRIFDHVKSTEEGRLASMGGMAVLTSLVMLPDYRLVLFAFLWAFASLMLWCSPAWDKYWSAEIGNEPLHSKLWGLAAMTLRMTLILPFYVGIAYIAGHDDRCFWAATTLLMGLPYLIFGAIDKSTAIPRSEFTVGALIGFTVCQIIAG